MDNACLVSFSSLLTGGCVPTRPQLRWTERETEQSRREGGMGSRGYKTEGDVESRAQGLTEILPGKEEVASLWERGTCVKCPLDHKTC